TLLDDGHAGAGGPNLSPPGGGLIAECVAHAPGAPSHVLLADAVAEHVPGCNMAFVRERLEAVGGFDPQFRVAGDDVDVCWRVQDRGWTLGYSPAAVVWHHRRRTLRAYWRQQRGYGAAEALLAAKWPAKYNAAGDVTWAGRLYGQRGGAAWRGRIYHGVWGTAPFQSVYDWPLAGHGILAGLIAGITGAFTAVRAAGGRAHGRLARWQRYVVTALLFVLQPAARLWGRRGAASRSGASGGARRTRGWARSRRSCARSVCPCCAAARSTTGTSKCGAGTPVRCGCAWRSRSTARASSSCGSARGRGGRRDALWRCWSSPGSRRWRR